MDNSKKERIRDLFITCTQHDAENAKRDDKDRVEVHFHGGFNSSICLIIRHNDAKWANELNAVLDEQIDRTVQHGIMAKIAHQKWPVAIVALLVLLLGAVIFSVVSPKTPSVSLSPAEIAKLDGILSESILSDQQKATKVILMLAHSAVISSTQETTNWQSSMLSWKNIFLIIPPLMILASLLYVVFFCYPVAVYAWGDGKDWYNTIVSRRKAVWSVVVISTVLGIIGNLFVVSLETFLR